ncbi:uncharacterized protein [Penaeus vannamei]|uniref:uncharacterized protein n=1 Tax=Penaeus vannamei TaxID=6689 RepID=UPI00387F6EF1
MDYDRPCGDGPSPDVSDSPVCSRRFFSRNIFLNEWNISDNHETNYYATCYIFYAYVWDKSYESKYRLNYEFLHWRPHGTSGNGILVCLKLDTYVILNTGSQWYQLIVRTVQRISLAEYVNQWLPLWIPRHPGCHRKCLRMPQGFASNPQRRPVLSEPPTGPAMKFAVAALVCLAAAVVAHADPEPHKYHHYPYHRYYHHPLHVKPLKGDGVAKHPGGGTSFVAPRVHGLGKRSADPEPAADPEPVADPDPSKSYSYQVVHHGYPHYGYHHGYRYPYYGYRYSHHYGYPYTYHKHHKRSADPEPEAEPNYRYYGHPHYYKGYYHGYPYAYPYYAGYRYRYRG